MSSSVPHLSPAQLRAALDVRDLSDPAAGPHAIQILTDRVVAALARTWSCEVRWCRGPRIVPVADNYDRLGYAADAITREARYTRYVSASRMLRSHATAMVPPALRRLARRPGGDDVLLACPGMVYRRDAGCSPLPRTTGCPSRPPAVSGRGPGRRISWSASCCGTWRRR